MLLYVISDAGHSADPVFCRNAYTTRAKSVNLRSINSGFHSPLNTTSDISEQKKWKYLSAEIPESKFLRALQNAGVRGEQPSKNRSV